MPAVLPDALICEILLQNSNKCPITVCAARQVSRAVHQTDALLRRGHKAIVDVPAHDPSLPLWLLQQMWPRTSPFFRSKLLEARCVRRALDHEVHGTTPSPPPPHLSPCPSVCRAAVGDQEGVGWLLDQGCPHSPTICTIAAGAGQLRVLQLLQARGLTSWDAATTAAAARGGHTHIIQWLRSQTPPCPWDADICFEAASAGQLATLQYLRSLQPPAPWCGASCLAAALRGDLLVLKWLRQQQPPCPWTCGMSAAASAHPEVVGWLREQRAP